MILQINPLTLFQRINDTARQNDLQKINQGFNDYVIQNQGINDIVSHSQFKEICDTEGQASRDDINCVDILPNLSLANNDFPQDPRRARGTGYYVRRNENDKDSIELYAPLAKTQQVWHNISQDLSYPVANLFTEKGFHVTESFPESLDWTKLSQFYWDNILNPYYTQFFQNQEGPIQETVSLVTDNDINAAKGYKGEVLAPNGYIYILPLNSDSILRINLEDDTVTELPETTDIGSYSAVLRNNGSIYGIPYQSSNNSILRLDVDEDGNETVSEVNFPDLEGGRVGGVMTPNGVLYGFPYDSSDTLLKIDTSVEQDQDVLLSGFYVNGI